MEDKYEEALQAVEDREQISHEDGMLVDVEETEHPRGPQEDHQHEGAFDTGPAK